MILCKYCTIIQPISHGTLPDHNTTRGLHCHPRRFLLLGGESCDFLQVAHTMDGWLPLSTLQVLRDSSERPDARPRRCFMGWMRTATARRIRVWGLSQVLRAVTLTDGQQDHETGSNQTFQNLGTHPNNRKTFGFDTCSC